jgi:hypothetical protein
MKLIVHPQTDKVLAVHMCGYVFLAFLAAVQMCAYVPLGMLLGLRVLLGSGYLLALLSLRSLLILLLPCEGSCGTRLPRQCVFIVCVYYCSTYYKAVRGGGGGEIGAYASTVHTPRHIAYASTVHTIAHGWSRLIANMTAEDSEKLSKNVQGVGTRNHAAGWCRNQGRGNQGSLRFNNWYPSHGCRGVRDHAIPCVA